MVICLRLEAYTENFYRIGEFIQRQVARLPLSGRDAAPSISFVRKHEVYRSSLPAKELRTHGPTDQRTNGPRSDAQFSEWWHTSKNVYRGLRCIKRIMKSGVILFQSLRQ